VVNLERWTPWGKRTRRGRSRGEAGEAGGKQGGKQRETDGGMERDDERFAACLLLLSMMDTSGGRVKRIALAPTFSFGLSVFFLRRRYLTPFILYSDLEERLAHVSSRLI